MPHLDRSGARVASVHDAQADAFRDLHGPRLHGFALLLTLGDRALAARLASAALADGATRLDDLRHPERAAAWLRRRVVRSTPRGRGAPSVRAQAFLEELGVEPAVSVALGRLRRTERAALIARSVERLDRHDVATIVGRDPAALDRLLQRARRAYVEAVATAPITPPAEGPLVRHIRTVAARAIE